MNGVRHNIHSKKAFLGKPEEKFSMDPTPLLKPLPGVIKVLYTHRKHFKAWVYCNFPRREQEVRFVLSHLLRICHHGKYLLIQNSHRPETLAPIGGVAKYYSHAQSLFDLLSFRPHVVDHTSKDNERDIRGFLPKKFVPTLYTLCQDQTVCESAAECLKREIREELKEINVRVPRVVDHLEFRTKWVVTEPLASVDHQPYLTHRQFIVSDLVENQSSASFLEHLKKGSNEQTLSFCSEDEIKRGRSSTNRILAATSSYLFSPIPLKSPLSSIPFKL